VHESLLDVGKLTFAAKVKARVFISLWRLEPRQTALRAELSFQIKYDPVKTGSRIRSQADLFYLELQSSLDGWLDVGNTKVDEVYRLRETALPIDERDRSMALG
jgi:hypothetical protein